MKASLVYQNVSLAQINVKENLSSLVLLQQIECLAIINL